MEKILKAFTLASGIIQGCPITNNFTMHFLASSIRNEKINTRSKDWINETKLSIYTHKVFYIENPKECTKKLLKLKII